MQKQTFPSAKTRFQGPIEALETVFYCALFLSELILETRPASFFIVNVNIEVNEKRHPKVSLLELLGRFELPTSSLPRTRSTD